MKTNADIDFDLTIDPLAYQTRGIESEMEKDISMLRKYTNRIAINSISLTTEMLSADLRAISNFSFLILALPHPECSFEWLRVIVDFEAFPGAKIEDYIPKSKKSDQPVKYTVSSEHGLKFEATTIKLGPSYQRKETEEHSVYFDEIRSGGLGSRKLNWDFVQQSASKLSLQNILLTKISHAALGHPAAPVISVEARLTIDGWKSNIPLIGSKIIAL